MNTIDYVYRFDPDNPTAKPQPRDSESARRELENGNRLFSQWMESCSAGTRSRDKLEYVVACNGQDVGASRTFGQMPKQLPFAVVVGCSDARVPLEMLFGQGFNDLFVVRVAGNVLGDVCLGSVDFAINALSDSVRVLVVLGHSGCGAVAGAVDSYLSPVKFWSRSMSPMLRSIIQRIFVAVRAAANGFAKVWGPDASNLPGYREALIESAVCINAAHAAFDLRQQVERTAKWEIDVFYAVHNIRNHQVSGLVDPLAPRSDENVGLAPAPTNPREFEALAIRMAEILKPNP